MLSIRYTYWGYKWEAKKESNRIRRENGKSEIRHAVAAGEEAALPDTANRG